MPTYEYVHMAIASTTWLIMLPLILSCLALPGRWWRMKAMPPYPLIRMVWGVVLLQVWYTYALFPILGNGNKSQYVLRH